MDVEERGGVSATHGGSYVARGSIRAGDAVVLERDGKTVRAVSRPTGPSAAFSINGEPPGACYRPRPGEEIVARLDSLAGVHSVAWFDLSGGFTIPLIGEGPIGEVCRIRAGERGTSRRIACLINGGIDAHGRLDWPSTRSEASWYVEEADAPAERSSEKPRPAPGQVWRIRYGTRAEDVGDYVVSKVDGERVHFADGSNMKPPLRDECVGLQLPDGRRMLVGETWEFSSRAHRHELVSVVVRVNGWGERIEGFRTSAGGEIAFSHVLADPPERWRKVEEGPARYTGADLDREAAGRGLRRGPEEPDEALRGRILDAAGPHRLGPRTPERERASFRGIPFPDERSRPSAFPSERATEAARLVAEHPDILDIKLVPPEVVASTESGPATLRTPEDADRLFGKASGIGEWMRRAMSAALPSYRGAECVASVSPPLPSPKSLAALRAFAEAVATVVSARRCPRCRAVASFPLLAESPAPSKLDCAVCRQPSEADELLALPAPEPPELRDPYAEHREPSADYIEAQSWGRARRVTRRQAIRDAFPVEQDIATAYGTDDRAPALG